MVAAAFVAAGFVSAGFEAAFVSEPLPGATDLVAVVGGFVVPVGVVFFSQPTNIRPELRIKMQANRLIGAIPPLN